MKRAAKVSWLLGIIFSVLCLAIFIASKVYYSSSKDLLNISFGIGLVGFSCLIISLFFKVFSDILNILHPQNEQNNKEIVTKICWSLGIVLSITCFVLFVGSEVWQSVTREDLLKISFIIGIIGFSCLIISSILKLINDDLLNLKQLNKNVKKEYKINNSNNEVKTKKPRKTLNERIANIIDEKVPTIIDDSLKPVEKRIDDIEKK